MIEIQIVKNGTKINVKSAKIDVIASDQGCILGDNGTMYFTKKGWEKYKQNREK